MSLLDQLGLNRHLSDADLAEVWTDASLNETRGATGARAHLLDCAQCRTRYADFTTWLDGIKTDARADGVDGFGGHAVVSSLCAGRETGDHRPETYNTLSGSTSTVTRL